MNGTSLMKPRVHDDDILVDLRRVAAVVGAVPTMAEYRQYGRLPVWTVRHRWGSWQYGLFLAGLTGRPRGRSRSHKEADLKLTQVTMATRSCLRCDEPFPSTGPENRLCGGCRQLGEGAA